MQAIGIDLDSDTINFATLDLKDGLINLQSIDIEQSNSSNVKPLYIARKKKRKNALIVSGLDAKDVLIKTSFIKSNKPLSKKAEKLQLESLTSLDAKSIIYAAYHHQEAKKLKFFITKKVLLKKHLDRLSHINIDPDHVTSNSKALFRFIKYISEKTTTCVICHIGSNKTTCVYIKNNEILSNHVIKMGNNHEKLGNLKEQINNTYNSFLQKEDEKNVPILITGIINNEHLYPLYAKKISISSEIEALLKYAISIGLCLDALQQDCYSLQFRKEEFTNTHLLQKIGKKGIIFSLLFLFFTLCFYFSSEYFLDKKENTLSLQLNHIIKTDHKLLNQPISIDYLNLDEKIEAFEKKLNKETKEFPYFLLNPKVTEVLYWLNNHSFLTNAEIISFKYELEKYPTIFTEKEPYIAKIELEFKPTNPQEARQFHESILKSEGYADGTKTVNWDIYQDIYKTSFYLKNKTPLKQNAR